MVSPIVLESKQGIGALFPGEWPVEVKPVVPGPWKVIHSTMFCTDRRHSSTHGPPIDSGRQKDEAGRFSKARTAVIWIGGVKMCMVYRLSEKTSK